MGVIMDRKTLKDFGNSNESVSIFKIREWLKSLIDEKVCCHHCRDELRYNFNLKE